MTEIMKLLQQVEIPETFGILAEEGADIPLMLMLRIVEDEYNITGLHPDLARKHFTEYYNDAYHHMYQVYLGGILICEVYEEESKISFPRRDGEDLVLTYEQAVAAGILCLLDGYFDERKRTYELENEVREYLNVLGEVHKAVDHYRYVIT